jgi:hypothetical protein
VIFEIIKTLTNDLNITIQQGFLMSRDRLGIPLREYFINWLQNKKAEVYLLDFQNVDEMTTSVAEELGPRLVESYLSIFNKFRTENNTTIFLTYCNLSPEVRHGLDTAMKTWPSKTNSGKKIVALGCNQNINNHSTDFFILGELPDALRETLFQIYQLEEVKSTDLDKLGIKASSRKLSELMETYPWLVRQEKQRLSGTSKAWSYVYKPIVTLVPENTII